MRKTIVKSNRSSPDRGVLTKEIEEKGKKLFGQTFNVTELRLLPYLQYISMNDRIVDLNLISLEEMSILHTWEAKGWIETENKITISKTFWDNMNTILLMAYVHNYDLIFE